MKKKSVAVLALGLLLGTGYVALAAPPPSYFSVPVATDLYNGNTYNGIPTPNATGLGYDFYNASNKLDSTTYTKNQQLDPQFKSNDATWTGGPTNVFLVGRTAKNTNEIGVATFVGGSIFGEVQLFSGVTGFGWSGAGTLANPYPAMNFDAPIGSTVKWYMNSVDWTNGSQTTFFSDPLYNPDGKDHMVTYSMGGLAGKSMWVNFTGVPEEYFFSANAYLVGFEDRIYGDYGAPYHGTAGDDDYNDILFLVDSNSLAPVLSLSQTMAPSSVPEPATLTLVVAGFAGIWLYGRRNRC